MAIFLVWMPDREKEINRGEEKQFFRREGERSIAGASFESLMNINELTMGRKTIKNDKKQHSKRPVKLAVKSGFASLMSQKLYCTTL